MANGPMTTKGYVLVWAILVLLAAGTFVTSYHVHGAWEVVAALGFAVAKMCIVLWFFMHLSHESVASRLAFAVALIFVALLIGLTLGDVMLRPDLQIHVPVSQ